MTRRSSCGGLCRRDAPTRRLTDQGKERKQQLLRRRQRRCSPSRGYGPTRIADICDAAGVAKGLFYWYFETKESLFAELVRTMRTQLRRSQAAAMDPDADAVTRIRQGAEASVRFMAEHMAVLRPPGDGADRRGDPPRAPRRQRGLHRRHDAGSSPRRRPPGLVPDDHDARLLAIGVHGAVSHFSHFHRSGRIDLPVDELAVFVGEWVTRASRPTFRPLPGR